MTDTPSIAEVFWPGPRRPEIPLAMYLIAFPPDWDPAHTDTLLIEAIVRGGKGTFGGTPRRDPHSKAVHGYSHSLIYLVDRKTGVHAVSFAPTYVQGPSSFGGEEVMAAMADTMPPLIVKGIETMYGVLKLRHKAIRTHVESRMHGQGHFRPKIFCVNRLDAYAYRNVVRMIEALHSPPPPAEIANKARMAPRPISPPMPEGRVALLGYVFRRAATQAVAWPMHRFEQIVSPNGRRHYQIAGLTAWNCDRFRRAARQAAGLPTSVMGRVCPWPAFRAAAICTAERLSQKGLPISVADARYRLLRGVADRQPQTWLGQCAEDWAVLVDNPSQRTRHYGPAQTRAMHRRAIRTGLINRPHRALYESIFDFEDMPVPPRSSSPRPLRLSRRALLGLGGVAALS